MLAFLAIFCALAFALSVFWAVVKVISTMIESALPRRHKPPRITRHKLDDRNEVVCVETDNQTFVGLVSKTEVADAKTDDDTPDWLKSLGTRRN